MQVVGGPVRRRNVKRSAAVGRVYSVAGGAPNKPTVVFVANAAWFLPTDGDDLGWVVGLQPQMLDFTRGFFSVADHAAVIDWIETDLAAWRADVPSRKNVPVIVAVDTSQSPAVYDRFMSVGRTAMDEAVRVTGFRLRPGDRSAILGQQHGDLGVLEVGAVWLVSWFNGTTATSIPDGQRHGRPFAPGRIVVNFAGFVDEEAPGLEVVAVRKALTAAEALIAKGSRSTDSEALITLDGDEVTAAALMLTVLSVELMRPPAERYHAGPWGSNVYGDRPVARFGVI